MIPVNLGEYVLEFVANLDHHHAEE